MKVQACKGYELQKTLSNTSEDYFNRSEVTYEVDGVTKTLSVLYLRYFEEKLDELTPFKEGIVCTCNGKDVHFKDVFALICLLKNKKLINQRKLYLGSMEEIKEYIEDMNQAELVAKIKDVQVIGE
ncbi:MAG: hypothetical protein ACI35O_02060 [Bacillaceae bacterium]